MNYTNLFLIIGNVIALIGSILMVIVGILNKKNQILIVQTIQIGLFIASNLFLGGITGVIINAISLVRNIICYRGKLGIIPKIIITVLSTSLSIAFNNLGFIGFLPVVSTVVYVWLMDIKDVKKFKLVVAFTMLMWFVYDITIKSYTSSIFDFISLISNLVTSLLIRKK